MSVLACCHLGGNLGAVNGREQHGGQDADDGNDHQQFNQRKGREMSGGRKQV
jgi:hypothetical protein